MKRLLFFLTILAATLALQPATASAITCDHGTDNVTINHVVVFMFENKAESQVDNEMPKLNAQMAGGHCGLNVSPGGFFAETSAFSQPNYVALTSGDVTKTDGSMFNNCLPSASCSTTRPSLFSQVTDNSYLESMGATNCRLTNTGLYVARHNPQTVYVGTGERTACNANNKDMGTTTSGNFKAKIAAGLPQFTLAVPNLCNSMHDCSVATGDNWIDAWLDVIFAGPDWNNGDTAVIVTWDEPNTGSLPIRLTSFSPTGLTTCTPPPPPYNHYGILQNIELEFGKPLLGNAATASKPCFGW